MSITEIHKYEVELKLSKAPSLGVAYDGFSVSHKLRNGSLYSGKYKFPSGMAKENSLEKAELVIIVPEHMVLEAGERIELFNPLDSVGFMTIKKLLEKNLTSKGSG